MTVQGALILYEQGRYDLAADELRRALANDPADGVAHSVLSLSLMKQRRLTEATREAQDAIATEPDLPLAHLAYAAVMHSRRRYTEARRAALEAIRLDPDESESYVELANIELSTGKWQASYDATSTGLALVPDHPELLRVRSVAARHLGRREEAQLSSRASLASVQTPQALASYGFHQMHSGQFREARATFENALQLDPMNDLARRGLIETIKARNVFYAVLLRYALWTSRISGRAKAVVLFATFSLYRVVLVALAHDPATHWLLPPVIVALVAFILSTWLAYPLSNLALLFHPVGRKALTRDERTGAVLVGVFVTVAVLGVAAFVGGA